MAFERVVEEKRKNPGKTIRLPEVQTSGSAGYDFYAPDDYCLKPGQQLDIWTDVKVKLPPCNNLGGPLSSAYHVEIVPRSSWGRTFNMVLANTIGIIDGDYYENPDNDGNIGICLINKGKETITIKQGERFAQGLIKTHFYFSKTNKKRKGGFGSTDQNKKPEKKDNACGEVFS